MGGYLDKSPVNGVKKYKENGPRYRYLHDDELKSFLSALESEGDTMNARIVNLLILTGLRKNELFTLKKSYVDINLGTIRLNQTKSGKSRVVALNSQAV